MRLLQRLIRIYIDLQLDMRDPPPSSIELLDGPTDCALLISSGGHQFEVARGRVQPHETKLHCTPILEGYAVVLVEYVQYPFIKTLLRPPPNDEIKYLGEAVLQRIQWKRGYI